MLRNLAVMLMVLTGLSAGIACASEASIRQGFQAKFPKATVESITQTPFAGIYEVVFNGQIAYTDEKLNFVFFGNLVDVRAGAERNLTRERSAQLTSQALRKSSDNAIKRVRGNGNSASTPSRLNHWKAASRWGFSQEKFATTPSCR